MESPVYWEQDKIKMTHLLHVTVVFCPNKVGAIYRWSQSNTYSWHSSTIHGDKVSKQVLLIIRLPNLCHLHGFSLSWWIWNDNPVYSTLLKLPSENRKFIITRLKLHHLYSVSVVTCFALLTLVRCLSANLLNVQYSVNIMLTPLYTTT